MSIGQQLTRAIYKDKNGIISLPKGSKTPAQTKAMKLFDTLPPLNKMPLWMARPTYKMVDSLFGMDKVAVDRVIDHQAPLTDGSRIVVREYSTSSSASPSSKRPALMFFHGGGCAIGDINSHDSVCRYIAKQSDLSVFSVNYRLGSEYKFPTAIEDAIQAWDWLCESADKFGIDLNKTGTGGDSAGAYLATLIAQLNKSSTRLEAPKHMPAFQWLLYPMLDLRGESESYKANTAKVFLTADIMNYFRDHYLNNAEERTDPLASPLLCDNLEGLPPAYVLTAEFDPLKDGGVAYAAKLEEAKNQVIHEHYGHLMHGFISLSGICPYARQAIDLAIDQLKKLAN